jgi:hypothetical protein
VLLKQKYMKLLPDLQLKKTISLRKKLKQFLKTAHFDEKLAI